MNDIRFLENKFFKEIKKHILLALPKIQYINFRLSTDEEDTKLSFDMVCNIDILISIRIRKNKFKVYNDLTIRSRSKNNGKTEIDKIMDNKSQIYFYAYMNEEENLLEKIRIVDVATIKKLTIKEKYQKRKNNDGTEFNTYLFSEIKKENGDIYQYDYKN
jgi:hypothetical protein|tara:strand:+ start:971 stop:1450 length:480 start_codon:yes stop_codon:yes gene_type:complete